jgi:hypothetical protein
MIRSWSAKSQLVVIALLLSGLGAYGQEQKLWGQELHVIKIKPRDFPEHREISVVNVRRYQLDRSGSELRLDFVASVGDGGNLGEVAWKDFEQRGATTSAGLQLEWRQRRSSSTTYGTVTLDEPEFHRLSPDMHFSGRQISSMLVWRTPLYEEPEPQPKAYDLAVYVRAAIRSLEQRENSLDQNVAALLLTHYPLEEL